MLTPASGDDQVTDRAAANSLHHLYSFLSNAGRVFVTYEADNDKHVNEIINFVALLRHNGFDTHVRTGVNGFFCSFFSSFSAGTV